MAAGTRRSSGTISGEIGLIPFREELRVLILVGLVTHLQDA